MLALSRRATSCGGGHRGIKRGERDREHGRESARRERAKCFSLFQSNGSEKKKKKEKKNSTTPILFELSRPRVVPCSSNRLLTVRAVGQSAMYSFQVRQSSVSFPAQAARTRVKEDALGEKGGGLELSFSLLFFQFRRECFFFRASIFHPEVELGGLFPRRRGHDETMKMSLASRGEEFDRRKALKATRKRSPLRLRRAKLSLVRRRHFFSLSKKNLDPRRSLFFKTSRPPPTTTSRTARRGLQQQQRRRSRPSATRRQPLTTTAATATNHTASSTATGARRELTLTSTPPRRLAASRRRSTPTRSASSSPRPSPRPGRCRAA